MKKPSITRHPKKGKRYRTYLKLYNFFEDRSLLRRAERINWNKINKAITAKND